jgi:hypothetical protein
MNLGSIDVGKVVGARGNSTQGGDGAGTDTSKDMVKVFCGKKVIGLFRGTNEVTLFGIEFSIVGGRITHAVDEVNMKKIRLCQTFLPRCFIVMGSGKLCAPKQAMTTTRMVKSLP